MERPSRLLALGLATVLAAACSASAEPSLAGPSSAPPSATMTPTPTIAPPTLEPTAPATGTTPPSPRPLSETTWHRVADQPAFANATMVAAASSEQGYVAIGCVFNAERNCKPVSWWSQDGLTWDGPAMLPADGVVWPQGVISSPSGFLAWGSGRGGITFWHLAGHVDAWQRAPAIPSNLGNLGVGGVVWFEDRFVAIVLDGAAEGSLPPPRAMESADGLTWSELATPDGCTGPQWINLLLVRDGRLVGLGTRYPTDGEQTRVVATSADGACWETSPLPIEGDLLTAAAALNGDRIVLAGILPAAGQGPIPTSPGTAAAWVSGDGRSWTAATFASGRAEGFIERFVRAADGYLALGKVVDRHVNLGIWTSAIWRSADGTTWTSGPTPEVTADGIEGNCAPSPCDRYRTEVADVVEGPVGLIAVGSTGSHSGPSRAVVWTTAGTN